MNNRLIKTLLIFLLAVISVFVFAACSSNKSNNDKSPGGEGTITSDGLIMPDKSKRKIVYTVNAVIETKDFEAAIQKLDASLSAINAKDSTKKASYIASSRTNFNNANRRMTIVFKINSDYLIEFISGFEGLGDMRSRNVDSEDITQNYTEVSALLETYQNEYDLYDELLKTETNYSARKQYIERMTELNEIINKYQNQINAYDEILEFSTVTLEIYGIGEAPKAELYGTKIAKVFYGSINAVVEFFKFLLLALIAVAPFAVIGTGVYFAVRPLIKRRKLKQERLREEFRRQRENRNNSDQNPK